MASSMLSLICFEVESYNPFSQYPCENNSAASDILIKAAIILKLNFVFMSKTSSFRQK